MLGIIKWVTYLMGTVLLLLNRFTLSFQSVTVGLATPLIKVA